jgi:hypothetical protein
MLNQILDDMRKSTLNSHGFCVKLNILLCHFKLYIKLRYGYLASNQSFIAKRLFSYIGNSLSGNSLSSVK